MEYYQKIKKEFINNNTNKEYDYSDDHFIWKNYSPKGGRQFFTEEIANKIEICLKDMIIKEKYKELQSAYAKIEVLKDEIKKLKKRKKSK